jgi:5-methylcytosine-specific restriction endonuclease McrA
MLEEEEQRLHSFIERKRDAIAYYIQEPAIVLRQRYLILAENNHCAALLLDVFKASTDWEQHDFVTFTLQGLQEALFGVFELSEICSALRLLLEREYLFLGPEPNLSKFHAYENDPNIHVIALNFCQYFAYKKQVLDERTTDPLTFLVDRPRILLLSEAASALLFPGLREIKLKRLKERYKTEEARVARHNAIAAAELLPASLNLIEWIATLTYFRWQCAYCGGPYHLIEHYIPIVHGGEPTWSGGTTWSNCVPACRSCNGKKGTQHPSLVRTMPALGRVERYLTAIRTIETMLQRLSQEQANNTQRALLATLDPIDRQIITSYGRNLASSRSLLDLQGRRRIGAIAAITFLLLAIAWFFAPALHTWDWRLLLIWMGGVVVCICGIGQALLTYFPKHRRAIETIAAFRLRVDEERIHRFVRLARAKQEELSSLQ